MHIHRLALIACLAVATSLAAQPACRPHPVATAVGSAVRRDARDAAARIAQQKAAEHAPAVISRSTVGSLWSAVASHLPHGRNPAKAEPAAPTPDCR